MVILRSQKEHLFFFEFMREVGMKHPGAWLGAQINQKRDFHRWYNDEEANDYIPVAPEEYNEEGLTCLDIGWDDVSWWRNWYCTGDISDKHFVACQRSATASFEEHSSCKFLLKADLKSKKQFKNIYCDDTAALRRKSKFL